MKILIFTQREKKHIYLYDSVQVKMHIFMQYGGTFFYTHSEKHARNTRRKALSWQRQRNSEEEGMKYRTLQWRYKFPIALNIRNTCYPLWLIEKFRSKCQTHRLAFAFRSVLIFSFFFLHLLTSCAEMTCRREFFCPKIATFSQF